MIDAPTARSSASVPTSKLQVPSVFRVKKPPLSPATAEPMLALLPSTAVSEMVTLSTEKLSNEATTEASYSPMAFCATIPWESLPLVVTLL